jgi:hypothetical protein
MFGKCGFWFFVILMLVSLSVLLSLSCGQKEESPTVVKARPFTKDVTVDYEKSVRQALMEAHVSPNVIVPKSFKQSGTKTLHMELFSMGRKATSEEVLEEMAGRNLRSANLAELLAFVRDYPKLERYIATLHSYGIPYVADGYLYVSANPNNRELRLKGFHEVWTERAWFLGIREGK